MDVELRRKPIFWETPKGLLSVVVAVAGVVGALASLTGHKIGAAPSRQQLVNIQIPPQRPPSR